MERGPRPLLLAAKPTTRQAPRPSGTPGHREARGARHSGARHSGATRSGATRSGATRSGARHRGATVAHRARWRLGSCTVMRPSIPRLMRGLSRVSVQPGRRLG